MATETAGRSGAGQEIERLYYTIGYEIESLEKVRAADRALAELGATAREAKQSAETMAESSEKAAASTRTLEQASNQASAAVGNMDAGMKALDSEAGKAAEAIEEVKEATESLAQSQRRFSAEEVAALRQRGADRRAAIEAAREAAAAERQKSQAASKAAEEEAAARRQVRAELQHEIRLLGLSGRAVDARNTRAVAAWREEAAAIRQQAQEVRLGREGMLRLDATIRQVENSFERQQRAAMGASGGVRVASARAERDLARLRGEVERTAVATERMGRGFSALTNLVRGFIGAFSIEALRRIGVALLDTAANTEMVGRSYEEAFGGASARLDQFLGRFGRLASLTRVAARDIATQAGIIVRGMGASEDAAAKFSERMLTIAGDLASFTKVPIEQAFQAIRSSVIGQNVPLQRLGISIREVDVQQRAMAESGKTSAASLTALEKAQARLLLITERMGPAAGALARNQTTLRSQLDNLRRSWADARIELADYLAPALSAVVRGLTSMMEWTRENGPVVKGLTATAGAAAAAAAAVTALNVAANAAGLATLAARLAAIVAALGGPAVVAGIAAVAGAVGVLSYNAGVAADEQNRFLEATRQLGDTQLLSVLEQVEARYAAVTRELNTWRLDMSDQRGSRQRLRVLQEEAARLREQVDVLRKVREERGKMATTPLPTGGSDPIDPAEMARRAAAIKALRAELESLEFRAGSPTALQTLGRELNSLIQRARELGMAGAELQEFTDRLGQVYLAAQRAQFRDVSREIESMVAAMTPDLVDDFRLAIEDLERSLRQKGATEEQIRRIVAMREAVFEAEQRVRDLRAALEEYERGPATGAGRVSMLRQTLTLLDEEVEKLGEGEAANAARAVLQAEILKLEREYSQAVAQTGGQMEQVAATQRSLADRVHETATGIARAANFAYGLAQAFGEADSKAGRLLASTVQISEGIGRIAKGDVFAGGVQTIGGLMGAIDSLMGDSPEAKRAREEQARRMRELTEALRELRETILQDVSSVTARGDLDFVSRLVDFTQSRDFFNICDIRGGREGGPFGQFMKIAMAAGFEDLQAFQRRLREVDERYGTNLLEFFEAGDVVGFQRAIREVPEAMAEAIDGMGAFGSDVASIIERIRFEAEILSETDPSVVIRRTTDALKEAGVSFGEFADDLGILTDASRSAAEQEAARDRILSRLREGTALDFGGLTPQQFRDIFRDAVAASGIGGEDGIAADRARTVEVGIRATAEQADRLLALTATSERHLARIVENTRTLAQYLGAGMVLTPPALPVTFARGTFGGGSGRRGGVAGDLHLHIQVTLQVPRGSSAQMMPDAYGRQIGAGIAEAVNEKLGSDMLFRRRVGGNTEVS